VKLMNPHLNLLEEDLLYHLSLGTKRDDLVEMFSDVRYVCMGGMPQRMKSFAEFMLKELGYTLPTGTTLTDISVKSGRYAMYKAGPVLSISHGMGIPSASILLHEVFKLLHYAKVKDPVLFRIGTSGGIGLPPGSVVITEQALDCRLRPFYEMVILGESVQRPADSDKQLVEDLLGFSGQDDEFITTKGKTVTADDFYESQGRLDGAICEFTEEDKMNYLKRMSEMGVLNMEMEALVFSALTKKAGIRAAVICITLLDRLKGDQVTHPKEELTAWQERPQKIVARYILAKEKDFHASHRKNQA